MRKPPLRPLPRFGSAQRSFPLYTPLAYSHKRYAISVGLSIARARRFFLRPAKRNSARITLINNADSQKWVAPLLVPGTKHSQTTVSGHAAADGGGDDAELGHELGEVSGLEGLRAIGKSVVGVVVDFDEQAVGAGGYGGAGHGRNFVAAPGTVGGVGEHGEMRKFFDYGDGGDVERVARVGLEGTDAALADNDVVIAAGEDVLGAEQQLFHGGGHAALEEDRLADFAECAEEIIILHIARADLEDVHVAEHHLDLRR